MFKGCNKQSKLLGDKNEQAHERVDKTRDENSNQLYAECKQPEPNEKGRKTGKALGKHVISLYLSGSQVVN